MARCLVLTALFLGAPTATAQTAVAGDSGAPRSLHAPPPAPPKTPPGAPRPSVDYVRVPSPTGEAQPGPEADRGPRRLRLLQRRPYYPIAWIGPVALLTSGEVSDGRFGASGLLAFPLLPMRSPTRLRRQQRRSTDAAGSFSTGQQASSAPPTWKRWYVERELQVAPTVGIPFLFAPGELEASRTDPTPRLRYERQRFTGGYVGVTLRRSRSAELAGLGLFLDGGWQFGRFVRRRCIAEACTTVAQGTARSGRVALGATFGRVALGFELQFLTLRARERVRSVGLLAGVHY